MRSDARFWVPPNYDVAADGRFVMMKSDTQPGMTVSLILNWQDALRQISATH